MVMTKEQLVRYWLSEPEIEPLEEGYIRLDDVPFPDLNTLTPDERAAMREVIARHPEYMGELIVWTRRLQ